MGAYYGRKVSAVTRTVVVHIVVRRADIFQDECSLITACVCVHISVQKRRDIRPENAATYAVWGAEQLISCDTDWERARLLMGCETGLIRECVGVVLAHISSENG